VGARAYHQRQPNSAARRSTFSARPVADTGLTERRWAGFPQGPKISRFLDGTPFRTRQSLAVDFIQLSLAKQISAKERKQVKLSRTYAISQVEYCFNLNPRVGDIRIGRSN
jgi:hypothetical protein